MLSITCPTCRRPLDRQPKTWTCVEGHSFDVAREGYVNLLLSHQKRSTIPGDSVAMLKARRAFLAAGHYDALQDAVVALIASRAPSSVLDVGCGDGYFTSAMTRVATDAAGVDIAGVDIAKVAIQMAARSCRGVTWLVGTAASLPFADASLDVVCCIFSQLHAGEMQRVLKSDGRAIIVTPAADHLLSLRTLLFAEVRAHDTKRVTTALESSFQPVTHREIRANLVLSHGDLTHLLAMTPYASRATHERRVLASTLDGLEAVAAFSVTSFAKSKVGTGDFS